MGVESEYTGVFDNGNGFFDAVIVFDRQSFCETVPDTNDGYLPVTVTGSLTTGQYFEATGTIQILDRHEL